MIVGRMRMTARVNFDDFAMRNIVCPDCGSVLGGYNLKAYAGREAEIEAAGIRSHKDAGDCRSEIARAAAKARHKR